MSPIPDFFKYASAFFAVPLGSLSYGSFLTASKISQNIFNVVCELKGSIIGLSKSGFKIISDSLIAFHPAIDEPSKKTPLLSISSSTTVESIVKCCSLPFGSVNLRSTNSTCLSLINFRTFLELILKILTILKLH